MKRKMSVALACAFVLTLLMAGAALAAALGVFGQFAALTPGSTQLQRLEEHAVTVDAQATFETVISPTETPDTDYGRLLAGQSERSFALTLNQAYCDGNRLYYSYTLETSPIRTEQGTGLPTGVESWHMEAPGKRYEEIWSNWDESLDAVIREQLSLSESCWYAYETWGLGDGAQLMDGTSLDVLSSDARRLDDCTEQGYQEVALPDGFVPGESLSFELTILYGMQIVHQDETGVRQHHIVPEENRGILRIPVTVDLTGTSQALAGAASFPQYTAQAALLVSDVAVNGTVTLHCPPEWTLQWDDPARETLDDFILGYTLLADGQPLPNLDGSLRIAGEGVLEIGVQYDPPDGTASWALCPEYAKAGIVASEAIPLRLDQPFAADQE